MSAAEVNSMMVTKAPTDMHFSAGKQAATFIDRTHYSIPYDHGYHDHGYHGYSYGGGGYGSSSKKKKSHSVALSALTLLAFLFFLHILQQCLQEHMDQMNPQVIVMQARQRLREAEAKKRVGESSGTIFANSSSNEPNLKIQKTTQSNEKDEYYYEESQIPVKLKTRQP